ncbi:MAG: MFS transporter [Muribaculaceae bacterium]|nr:MFS transporter [Muribaculaceae bacterium]
MNIANGFYIPDPAFTEKDDLEYKGKKFVLVNAVWENGRYVYYGNTSDAKLIAATAEELAKKAEEQNLFENWIATTFPDKFKQVKSNNQSNNFAVVAVRLNKKPDAGKEYVLNLANDKGSTDIKASQSRIVFNENNWNKLAYIYFTVDNKVKKDISSSFLGTSGNIPMAWAIVFVVLSVFFLIVVIYHTWALPRPAVDSNQEKKTSSEIVRGFLDTFRTFFTKFPVWQTVAAILFMLFYRFPEAQLTKIIMPFLVDPLDKGGLALSTSEVGIVYGTVGIIGLTIGGIIGGIVAAKGGLKHWLQPMAWSMSLTCLTFIYLAFTQDQNLLTINICVFIEQFGYGFGFTAYMLYLIYYSEGPYKTAHYAT